ncbi:HigA family addiction module antitoxin [Clostridium perfringens]|uniref:HigA family addiction module antitoxin n=1 Tax=Clostridium perfringens TaxID=1502 RepID=UPI0013E2A38A|nr:HigA family addiction module antitoxin [Clostridium perfringens]EHK2337303.1 HigA family addiction module antidote protein [Clostridium perfringens]EIF5083132.1 HigA family addiction module antidote protein [Clostridium perfringens]MDK0548806.1 HigA family addiction module antitoxin [Clostridium perfringens]MDK0551249.1 HigA family addiction module antitoxin [Clostridium perfringens]MDK0833362.1 HigA family addiction module antitoxin [Clostridium perfringens]
MVNKKENNEYLPMIAIPPGETIKENMDFLGMKQKELAARMGISEKHLSDILNGKSPITYDTAIKLESIIGPSAEFWMELENGYQLDKARLAKEDELKIDLEILKDIKYNDMVKNGWVEKTNFRKEKVENCRKFFGVANLSLIENATAVMFRKKQNEAEKDLNVLAWLRQSELVGMKVETGEFNRNKLKRLIPVFRELTLKDASEFYPKMKELCAKCGVALVLVEDIPGNGISGATIWRKNKPILSLTVRGKRADIFWFTFFHEIAHIINHKKEQYNISFDKDDFEIEKEANELARDYLIPNDLYKEFLCKYSFNNRDDIIMYSKKINIAPSILVGRLMFDQYISYDQFSDLRPSFRIVYN